MREHFLRRSEGEIMLSRGANLGEGVCGRW